MRLGDYQSTGSSVGLSSVVPAPGDEDADPLRVARIGVHEGRMREAGDRTASRKGVSSLRARGHPADLMLSRRLGT